MKSPKLRWPRIKDYPSQLKICRVYYAIRFVSVIEGDPNLLGLCDQESYTIFVKLGQTPKERWKTVFHEILHAYEFESGVEIGERHVRLVEHWVSLLLGDNFKQMIFV